MGSAKRAWTAGVLALLLCAGCGHAQTPAPPGSTASPGSTEEALHAMARRAGVIFTGRVVGVRRHEGGSGSTGVVEIEFAVEDAVRGVSGGSYTLREWAGLWPPGDQPYCVGGRFLMLLHAPGAAGLSSPIGGMDGAIPIGGGSQSAGPNAEQPLALAARPSRQAVGFVVDLRWVETRVSRAVSYPGPVGQPPSRNGPVPANAEAASSSAAATTTTAPMTQNAGYPTVLAMLRDWDRDDHATR
jgi:hypothetical protein